MWSSRNTRHGSRGGGGGAALRPKSADLADVAQSWVDFDQHWPSSASCGPIWPKLGPTPAKLGRSRPCLDRPRPILGAPAQRVPAQRLPVAAAVFQRLNMFDVPLCSPPIRKVREPRPSRSPHTHALPTPHQCAPIGGRRQTACQRMGLGRFARTRNLRWRQCRLPAHEGQPLRPRQRRSLACRAGATPMQLLRMQAPMFARIQLSPAEIAELGPLRVDACRNVVEHG